MAELSEVESVLTSVVSQIVYPNGTGASSATGDRCKVYRGWPVPASLDADLKAGVVNISVFPIDPEQNVTRYDTPWLELPTHKATLTLSVSGKTVTVGGMPRCPLNAAVEVDGTTFVHPLQATDTTTSIATAIATLISTATGASSSGPVITVPGAIKLQARTGVVGSLIKELKRQKRSFRITVWCNNPLIRDAIGSVVDQGLSALTFLTLHDSTDGRIRYERTHVDDSSQKSGLYRRDFVYSVEYATTQVLKSAAIVAETVNVTLTPNPL